MNHVTRRPEASAPRAASAFARSSGLFYVCAMPRLFSTSFLGAVLLLSACREAEPHPSSASLPDGAPLSQRAYIWQRDWNAPVGASLAEGREVLDGCVVLGAEIEWKSGNPRAIKPRVDWLALRTFGKPVSVAMRIAPSPGPFS